MKDYKAKVTENKKIAQNVFMLTLKLPEKAGEIRGGQFVNISTGSGEHLLRRPLGICTADGDEISVCYQLKGRGTRYLSTVEEGRELNVLLPLGNGFDLDGYKDVAVVGGGVGIFPLICAIRENYRRKNFYTYVGFKNEDAVCLYNELNKSKKLVITTDDGSYGEKGNAVSAFISDLENIHADVIISCGPPVMLKVLKEELLKRGEKTPCFVSLEERMGCGLGACLVCVCKSASGDNLRVCRDGPVFEINEVQL